jgi:predicted RNase H-like nuclease
MSILPGIDSAGDVTGGRRAPPFRFLGVDLAWKRGNASGLVALEGDAPPLRLWTPPPAADHAAVLDWIAAQAREAPAVVGIDAPLLGLDSAPGHRPCDRAVSRAFGRFHAAVRSPSGFPDLPGFTAALLARHGRASFAPTARPRPGWPAIREVYPHAFQVGLLGLAGRAGARILPYKRRRFAGKAGWAEGLARFADACAGAVAGTWVDARDPAWVALRRDRPGGDMPARRLKAIEDRWDALLCALAVAWDRCVPGSMRFYPSGTWEAGAILAPALPAFPAGSPAS